VVENFHGRVEDEFYTLEPLPTEAEMLERLFGYILYYNFGRPNEGLGMQTPVQALQAKAPAISPDVAAFPPVVLDRIELSAAELLPPVSGGSGENRPDAHLGDGSADLPRPGQAGRAPARRPMPRSEPGCGSGVS